MKKTITLGIMTSAMLLAGCATVQAPQKPQDIEPALVGRPVAERIQESENDINNQVALLDKINSGQKVGTYNVVTHNNDLDARVGSSQTIPQAYARGNKALRGGSNWTPEATSKDTVTTVAKTVTTQKVKRIEWQNNSLNKLSENLAKALGYELVIKEGTLKDKNINFTAENKTLPEVVQKLKAETASFADIVVIDQNKTFNIFYK